MDIRIRVLTLLFCSILVVKSLDVVEKTLELAHADIVTNDQFGYAVDASDKYIAIGVPGATLNTGSVIVYSKIGNQWDNGSSIPPPIISNGGNFGWSVALHDNKLIVGSPTHDSGTGIAYIFQNNGTAWTLSSTLLPNSTQVKFGQSVSLTADLAVVGCEQSSVFVFRNTAINAWLLEAGLTASDGTATDMFGSVVAASGDYVGVGARDHQTNGKRKAGAAYIFHRNNLIWSQVQKLTSESPAIYDNFGYSIDMDGDRVVVGCTDCNDTRGNVYVFTKDINNNIQFTAKLNPSDVGQSDFFGTSVSISGDKIAIGASHETTPRPGTAYVFHWTSDTWIEDKKLTGPSGAGFGAIFGKSIAIYNDLIVVGSPGFDDSLGTALVFDFTPTSAFTVECFESFLKGVYYKNHIPSDQYEFSLNDQSCNSFQSNDTHAWMTADFDKCGTFITEDETSIIADNAVHVRLLTYRTNITVTETMHQYNMRCEYPRNYKLTINGGYIVTVNNTQTINTTSAGIFTFLMDIYDSIEFLQKSSSPITVTSGQPIYVGIRSVDSNATIKFAVDECFATPGISTDSISDVFFHKKCKVDDTFQQILSSPTRFRYVINAFRFIQVAGAVYLHCRINVCMANSNSPLCEQTCSTAGRRKRRELLLPEYANGGEAKEVTLTSKRVNYKQKSSCKDIKCPENSQCVELYPAHCRCDPGYVFAPKYNTCSNELILDINEGLRLDLQWLSKYNDTSSIEFLSLAIKIENIMSRYFAERNISHFEGIKVTKFQKGSVIADYSIKHSISSNSRIVYETLSKTVSLNTSVIADSISKLEVQFQRLPDPESNNSMKNNANLSVIIFVSLLISSSIPYLF